MKIQDNFLCGKHFNIGILDNKIPMEDDARFIHFNRKPRIVIFK